MRRRFIIAVFLCAIFAVGLYIFYKERNCIQARLAVDIGSGSTKTEMALIDKCKNTFIKNIHDANYPIKMVECMQSKQNGGLEINDECVKQINNFFSHYEKEHNLNCSLIECTAIATEWARLVENSSLIIEEFKRQGLNVKVINQATEGFLSFESVKHKLHDLGKSSDNFVVWDLGGGSFQLTTAFEENKDGDALDVYHGRTGVEVFTAKARAFLNKEPDEQYPYFTANEIAKILANTDKLIDFTGLEDSFSYKRLQNNATLIATGAPFYAALIHDMGFSNNVNKAQLYAGMHQYSGKTIDEILKIYPATNVSFAKYNQSSVLLIYIILDKLKRSEFEIVKATLTRPLFTNSSYW